MNVFLGWSTAFRIIGRYLLYRMGLAKPPSAEGQFEGLQQLIGQFVGWNRYMRVRHPELWMWMHRRWRDLDAQAGISTLDEPSDAEVDV